MSKSTKNRPITIQSVIADLERVSADLSFLGLHADAEDVNRTLRYLEAEVTA